MGIVKTENIKSPWDITISLNNGFLDDIEIRFIRVVLREKDVGDFVLDWCEHHLKITNEVRVSYNAINSNSVKYGRIKQRLIY